MTARMPLEAKRYATALFEVAERHGALDEVGEDLRRIRVAFADPALRALVLDPDTPAAARGKAVEALAEDGHELTKSFVRVLLPRRRQALLPELGAAFEVLLRNARGEALAVVETPRELSDDVRHALQQTAERLSGKTVTLDVQHVPELIGGVRLRVGNTLYDASVASALDELEQRLMAAPIP